MSFYWMRSLLRLLILTLQVTAKTRKAPYPWLVFCIQIARRIFFFLALFMLEFSFLLLTTSPSPSSSSTHFPFSLLLFSVNVFLSVTKSFWIFQARGLKNHSYITCLWLYFCAYILKTLHTYYGNIYLCGCVYL